jgi:hypothetical protein
MFAPYAIVVAALLFCGVSAFVWMTTVDNLDR